MNIPIGWLIALTTAFGGFYWLGGEFKQLWVPEEYLIIFGAALGALVASNKWRNLKNLCVKRLPCQSRNVWLGKNNWVSKTVSFSASAASSKKD